MSIESHHDPRVRLVREKYFSLRPKPLERWLWSQGVPASAERVFWLHWQEGLQRGDWCSEVPLKRVARECCLDLSTVTRAYQLLSRLGCLQRTDPGRDAARPFNQAVAVTEVRVPRQLLVELERHPNRRAGSPVAVPEFAPPAVDRLPTAPALDTPKARDPFAGLRAPERIKALAQLTHAMSAGEATRFHEALRTHQGHMAFDDSSTLPAELRGQVLQFLAVLAATPASGAPPAPANQRPGTVQARKLSLFELARLKRDIQTASTTAAAPEIMRQVVWSIEEGALRRFTPIHGIHIALKKIREGSWTRPNRMPPNWSRSLSTPAMVETCRRA
jgi:hypothetical protein